LPTISDILLHGRMFLFGHVARLDPGVPVNTAVHLIVNNDAGMQESIGRIRPPGRPRRTWLNLIQEDVNTIPLSTHGVWRAEIARGHGAA